MFTTPDGTKSGLQEWKKGLGNYKARMHVGINAEAILIGAKRRLADWWVTGRRPPSYKELGWMKEQAES